MAEMNLKRQKIHNQIFGYCCMALVFFMPIYAKILPSIIFLMVLNWIIEAKFKKIPAIFSERHRILTFSFAALYVLYLIGMLYSKNMDYGLFDLEIKFSLILFPLIFATVDRDFPFQKLIINVFKAFIAGCMTGTLILFAIALYSYIGSRNPAVFFYTTFSKFIHVSYLSMYLNLAVSILAYYLIRKEHPLTNKIRILLAVLAIYFSFVIFLLSSKAGIFSLLFLSLMIILYLLFINKQISKGLLFLCLVMITFYAGFRFLPTTAGRFKKTESVLSEQKITSPENMESNSERLDVWKAGIEVIRKHPVFGVGTGDVKDALLSEYLKENKLFVYNMRLNALNQFFQTYIALGILGALLLIFMLVLPGWLAIRRIHFIYFSFLAVFTLNILVESMLEVQAGVVYYAFFNSLFFFGWKILADRSADKEIA
jgi:O-antigen ligase